MPASGCFCHHAVITSPIPSSCTLTVLMPSVCTCTNIIYTRTIKNWDETIRALASNHVYCKSPTTVHNSQFPWVSWSYKWDRERKDNFVRLTEDSWELACLHQPLSVPIKRADKDSDMAPGYTSGCLMSRSPSCMYSLTYITSHFVPIKKSWQGLCMSILS